MLVGFFVFDIVLLMYVARSVEDVFKSAAVFESVN